MQQNTEEWHQARLGKVTASRIAEVMAQGRGSAPSATRANYRAQLVVERLTDRPTDTFTNAAMQHGTETEPQARATYTLTTGRNVEEAGFVDHPTIVMAGASPDGLVGDDGLVEIKCPNSATHIATLLGAEIDGKYVKQMQWQMACTGRAWCDFVSFDPRLPDEMQIHIRRVERDEGMIADLMREVRVFLAEVDAEVAALTAKYLSEAA
jgi:putative phage-type endonuclease